MTIVEMKIHIFQVITFLADTYEKATNDTSLKELFVEFGNTFAKKTGIVKKDNT